MANKKNREWGNVVKVNITVPIFITKDLLQLIDEEKPRYWSRSRYARYLLPNLAAKVQESLNFELVQAMCKLTK